MTQQGRDVAVAAVTAVGLTASTLTIYFLVNSRQPVPTWVPPGTLLTACALTVAGCVPLALRRSWPRSSLAGATALVLVTAALALKSMGPAVGLICSAYSVGLLLTARSAAPALVGLAAAHAAGGVVLTARGGEVQGLWTFWGVPGHDWGAVAVASVASFGLPTAIGAVVRRRRARELALTARAERLEAEREERDRAAAAEERRRIARELHDIAAHDLSAIVVQAGAADRLVGNDSEAVRAILRDIRGQGRDTLIALRQLVGIMRDDDAGGRAPAPGLARIEDLLAVARAAGGEVELSIVGPARPLPALIDLAAFRVVQESLTNARRHAPGAPVTVVLTYSTDSVRIQVTNQAPGAPTGSGHGLVGMRERVRQAGGTLAAGPDRDGRWRVDARLPA